MGNIKSFKDLVVWQKSHQLVIEIYKLTKQFPIEEKFGLVAQMRKAATSIPANIVEGFKKKGTRDKGNFYNIAEGSLEELKYYLILSKDLKYIDNAGKAESLSDELGRLLHSLIKTLILNI